MPTFSWRMVVAPSATSLGPRGARPCTMVGKTEPTSGSIPTVGTACPFNVVSSP